MDKPLGDVAEYDALNSLVDFDDPGIVERSIELAALNGWGICRARMRAIIDAVSSRLGWPVGFQEAQRRALILAQWKEAA